MAEFLKRHAKGGPTFAPVGPADYCRWMQAHPAICEFLTLASWEGGDARETGTLLLCFGDGQFKCWLNDRDGGRTAWLSGPTVSELLTSAEERLAADTLDWRAAPSNSGRKKVK